MRSSFPRVILFTLLAMLLQGAPIGKSLPWTPMEQSGDIVTVKITADGPVSPTVTITVGMAIQWYNTDDVSHTITSDTRAFTVTLGTDDQTMKALTAFDTVGTFPYHLDAGRLVNVTGTIIVIGSSSTPTDSPTPADTSTPTATSTSSPSATPSATATASTATTAIPPSDTPTATATSQPLTTVPVTITDAGFLPSSITVSVGAAVQWTNERSSSMTLVVNQGTVFFGLIAPGASETLAFTQTGLYTCTLAYMPGIIGLVLVVPTALTPSPTTNSTSTGTASPTNSPVASASFTVTPPPSATGASVSSTTTPTSTSPPSATLTPTPVLATVTLSPTASPTQAAGATATTLPPNGTATIEATNSPTASAAIAMSLTGGASVPCISEAPIGTVVRWSNDNLLGGISYDLLGTSPDTFMMFSQHLDPGDAVSYTFTDEGLFTYNISSKGTLLTTAVIPVGVGILCPVPSATATEAATTAASLTSTPTAISPSPTAVPPSTPTSTPTSRFTSTPAATSTATPIPTHTSSPASTPIPTPASEPSSTPTATTTTQPPSFIPLQTPASSGAPPSPTAAKHTQAKPTVQTKTTTKRKQTVQPCWSALPREQVAMRVRGYLQHGPVRVAISLDLQVSAQRFSVTLHWRDPRSRLDLTGLYFSRPQIICRGLRLQGTASLGKHRRVPFVLQMAGLLRGKTTPAPVLDLALSALHYRLHGVLRGQKPLAVHYGVPIPPPVHKKGHP